MRKRPRVTLSIAVPLAVTGMMLAGCASSALPAPTATTQSQSPSPASAAARAPLRCAASVTSRHPAQYTTVGVRVRTAPHARITADADYRFKTITNRNRASSQGRHTVWYQIGAARRGFRVVVYVTTSRHGRKGYCQAWFRLPRRARTAVPAPSPSAPAPSPPASAASCYPTTPSGNCYEPGEFCSLADHGMSGVAGDGERITCADNNGWRWEPA